MIIKGENSHKSDYKINKSRYGRIIHNKKLRICRNIQTLTKNWYNFNLNY